MRSFKAPEPMPKQLPQSETDLLSPCPTHVQRKFIAEYCPHGGICSILCSPLVHSDGSHTGISRVSTMPLQPTGRYGLVRIPAPAAAALAIRFSSLANRDDFDPPGWPTFPLTPAPPIPAGLSSTSTPMPCRTEPTRAIMRPPFEYLTEFECHAAVVVASPGEAGRLCLISRQSCRTESLPDN